MDSHCESYKVRVVQQHPSHYDWEKKRVGGSILKKIICALAVALASIGGSAEAATYNFEATITNVFDYSHGGSISSDYFFTTTGVTPVSEIKVNFSVDLSKSPISQISSGLSVQGSYDRVHLSYSQFSVTIGSETYLGLPSTVEYDSIRITNGITDGTKDQQDAFEVISSSQKWLSPDLQQALLGLHLYDFDESFWNSTSFPSLDTLNALANVNGLFRIRLNTPNNAISTYVELRGTVSSIREIPPIPLPATLPLMFAGLAGLGWIGKRRKRT